MLFAKTNPTSDWGWKDKNDGEDIKLPKPPQKPPEPEPEPGDELGELVKPIHT